MENVELVIYLNHRSGCVQPWVDDVADMVNSSRIFSVCYKHTRAGI